MEPKPKDLSRRDFLKICGVGAGALALWPIGRGANWQIKESYGGSPDLGPNPELLPKEEKSGTITTEKMPVMLFPIKASWLYDYYTNWLQKTPNPVKEIELTGVDFAYKDLFLSVSADGSATRYTLFPYITGDQLIAIGKYDEGTFDYQTQKYTPLKTFYKEEVLDKDADVPIAQCHTIISGFYPNKVWNDLQASIQIDKYQHSLNGFRAGVPASYVDAILTSVKDLRETYRLGRTGFAANLDPAGGVCATATNMCKMQIEAGSQITQREPHEVDVRYFYGPGKPFALAPKNADATVYYQDQYYREDMVWVPKADQWIKISAAFVPYAQPVAGTARVGDALLFLTFRATNRDPGDQTVALKKLQGDYDTWRKDPSEINKNILLNGCVLTQEISWTPDSETAGLIRSISPEDRVGRFSTEIKQEQILKDILELQGLIPGYSYDIHYKKGIYLGDYLRNSDWYSKQVARLNSAGASTVEMEKALDQLSHDCNLGNYEQPMQCVGLDILMAALNYQDYPFYNFYYYDAANAKTLCPWTWRNIVGAAVTKYTFANWQEIDKVVANLQPVDGIDMLGHKFTAFNAKTLEEIQVGDIFVNMSSDSGHTGLIVGKKNVDGDTVLLVTDANGAVDGLIHIYEVDKRNFDIAFGVYPYPKTMIRKK
jgi:hypothetical protein